MPASQPSRQAIQKAYIAYYGRPADPSGLEYWASRLDRTEGALSELIDAFGTSQEFEENFGFLGSEELINNLYQQLFGRDADSSGLAYYLTQLTDGTMSLSSIALDILNGAQSEDEIIIEQKLQYADQFSLKVKAMSKTFSDTDMVPIKLMLKSIGNDSQSFQRAVSVLDDMIEGYEDVAPETGVNETLGKFTISGSTLQHLVLGSDPESVIVTDSKAKAHIFDVNNDDTINLPDTLTLDAQGQALFYSNQPTDELLSRGAQVSGVEFDIEDLSEWVGFFLADDNNRLEIGLAWNTENKVEADINIVYEEGFVKLHDLDVDDWIVEGVGLAENNPDGRLVVNLQKELDSPLLDASSGGISIEPAKGAALIGLIGFYAAEGVLDFIDLD